MSDRERAEHIYRELSDTAQRVTRLEDFVAVVSSHVAAVRASARQARLAAEDVYVVLDSIETGTFNEFTSKQIAERINAILDAKAGK